MKSASGGSQHTVGGKTHYQRNKAVYVAKALRRSRARREEIQRRKERPCMDCGLQYPHYVMQFDHVRGVKCFEVAQGWKYSYDKVEAEIKKCDLVCSNCHAERTHQRRTSVAR